MAPVGGYVFIGGLLRVPLSPVFSWGGGGITVVGADQILLRIANPYARTHAQTNQPAHT